MNKPAKHGIPGVKGYCGRCGLTGGQDCPPSGPLRTRLKKLDTRRVRRIMRRRLAAEERSA